jgi:hypothetical protein
MKTMFLTVFFVLSSLAHATESVRDSASTLQTSMTSQSASEYLYIPAPGTGRFQLAPKIESRQYELKGDYSGMKKTREYKSQIIQLAYDHAFQQAGLSLGVETGFGSAASTTTINGNKNDYKFKGNSDVALSLRKVMESPNGNVQFGGTLSLSPGKANMAYTNEDGNMYSGGHSLTPFVGLDVPTSFGAAGGLLSYSLMGQRETEARGYQETSTGGNLMTIGGFAEFKQSTANIWGGSLAFLSSESGSFEDSDGEKGDFDSEQHLNASAYGRLQVTEKVSLKPTIGYSTLLTKNINGVSYDKSENFDLSLGLLMNF